MNVRLFAACIVPLTMAGCSKVSPIVLSPAQGAWFGSWEHTGGANGGNIIRDDMLLVVYPDSTVRYLRCIDRKHGHSYTSMADAGILAFDDHELEIGAQWFVLRWTEKLQINRPPYLEGEDTYVNIDGLKLRRLGKVESSTREAQKCSEASDVD